MRAIVNDNQWIWFDNITVAEEEVLWANFSVQESGIYIDPSQRGLWDGVYRKYNRAKQRMARPLLSMLRGVCAKNGLPLVVRDYRDKWKYQPLKPEEITANFLPGITLDQHQIRAIQAACKIECGIIDVPTGGGKGEIICGICKAIDCPTIIVADQTVVIDQLKARLELREIDEEIGLFYSGQRPSGEKIIVGSIQSLQSPTKVPPIPERKLGESDAAFEARMAKWEQQYKGFKTRQKNAKYLQAYAKTAEMIIVDECVDENSYINIPDGVQTAGSLFRDVKSGMSRYVSVGGKPYLISDASERYGEAVDIITVRGRRLRTSGNHLFATFSNGVRRDVHANELLNGSLLLVNDVRVQNVDYDPFWYFVGLFIGDGHLLNMRQIKFGVRKDFADWRAAIRSIAVQYSAEMSSNINSRGDLVIRLKSRAIVEKIRSLGFEPGRKMGNINPAFDIPSNSAVCSMLRGLFDSEGSSYPTHVNFDSSDKPLAEFVQIILSSVGIKSSLYVGNKRGNIKHATGWRVSISGSDLNDFWRLIGFGFTRKSQQHIVDRLNGARYIDPTNYIKQWRDTIPTMKLAAILGCHHTKLNPNNSDYISLDTLIKWQIAVLEASSLRIGNYGEAKRLFGLSDKIIATVCGVSTMTSWNHRNDGDSSLVSSAISAIQNKLAKPIVDTSLYGYAVEPIDRKIARSNSRLIDFTVEGVSSFEANGILVHNCDKAVSDPYKKLFRHWFQGRRRYGMSGTPFDPEKPVAAMVMQEHLGSVIAKESRFNLEKIGRIIPCEYWSIAFGIDGSINEGSAYDIARNDFMTENPKFHNIIASICKKYKGDGTLILVDAIPLGEHLERVINAAGLKAHFIYGQTPKRRRNELLRSFEKRNYDVLIGGKIINRGLDLAGGCENLIIATGGKLQSDFIQKVGRALRHNKLGRSRIFDFYFRCNKYLYSHSKARLKAMVNSGYRTVVVLPGGSVDGAQLIRSRFQINKKLFKPTPRVNIT